MRVAPSPTYDNPSDILNGVSSAALYAIVSGPYPGPTSVSEPIDIIDIIDIQKTLDSIQENKEKLMAQKEMARRASYGIRFAEILHAMQMRTIPDRQDTTQ